MKKLSSLLIVTTIVIAAFTSCKNDKAELLYPPDACDSINVTYSGTILPILRDNCYRCHAGSATVGPFNLDSYADVSIYAANTKLLGAVSHAEGYQPMPKDASKLSTCNLGKIRKWIADGYPDN